MDLGEGRKRKVKKRKKKTKGGRKGGGEKWKILEVGVPSQDMNGAEKRGKTKRFKKEKLKSAAFVCLGARTLKIRGGGKWEGGNAQGWGAVTMGKPN